MLTSDVNLVDLHYLRAILNGCNHQIHRADRGCGAGPCGRDVSSPHSVTAFPDALGVIGIQIAAVALRPGVAQAEAIVAYIAIDGVVKAVMLAPGSGYLPDMNDADTAACVVMFAGMLGVLLAARAVESRAGTDLTLVRRTAATGLCMAAIIIPGLLMAESNAFGTVRMAVLMVASLFVLIRSLVRAFRDEPPFPLPASTALPPAASGHHAMSGHLE